tara:strand:+ start:1112 stop:1555 length:444 start_codon:yes stop_codon:yes gene_type:complete
MNTFELMQQQVMAIHGESLDETFKEAVEYIEKQLEQDASKKILFAMPQSAGDVFLSTSLFRSMQDTYPGYNIYVATGDQYKSLLDDNPYVYKVLSWHDCMVAQAIMLGSGVWKGFFDIFFTPFITTQTKFMNYVRNGQDKIAFDLRY